MHDKLKIITSFDYLKKIVLKSPEFWSTKKEQLYGQGEIISTNFNFRDFFKAFKVINYSSSLLLKLIAKIGYRNIDESNQVKMQMLVQYIKKQYIAFLNRGEKLAAAVETASETRSSKDQNQIQYQSMLKH
jgi:hypothetical protein